MFTCPKCNNTYDGNESFCPVDGTPLKASGGGADPWIGKILEDRYRLLEQLGEGGMGIVLKAEHILMEKIMALKILHHNLASNEQAKRRFKREARSASRLNHPNIITITDFGETKDGQCYLVMEFLEGHSLAGDIKHSGPIPITRLKHILLQVLHAVAHAHEQGVIHRDLKPDNIHLINQAGAADWVKVLDFGLAKLLEDDNRGSGQSSLTAAGMVFGTPEYMAPEQALGKKPDNRTDLYAIGVMAYQMACGRLPFTADSAVGLLTKHVSETPKPLCQIKPELHLPRELGQVVHKAMEKDPKRRYQSAQEFFIALQSVPEQPQAPSAVAATEYVVPSSISSAPDFVPISEASAKFEEQDAMPISASDILGEPVMSRTALRRGNRSWVLVLALLMVAGGIAAAVLKLSPDNNKKNNVTRRALTDPKIVKAPARLKRIPLARRIIRKPVRKVPLRIALPGKATRSESPVKIEARRKALIKKVKAKRVSRTTPRRHIRRVDPLKKAAKALSQGYYDAALIILNKVRKKDVLGYRVNLLFGDLHYKKGKYPKALYHYNLAKNKRASSTLFLKMGHSYFKLRSLGNALDFYKKALAKRPDSSTQAIIHYWLGRCYYGLKRYKKALDAFRASMRLGHDEAESYRIKTLSKIQ